MPWSHSAQIADLERRVNTLEYTLGTLLVWMGQSAASPLSVRDVEKLLRNLNAQEQPPPPEQE
jgi:hypothetical protein